MLYLLNVVIIPFLRTIFHIQVSFILHGKSEKRKKVRYFDRVRVANKPNKANKVLILFRALLFKKKSKYHSMLIRVIKFIYRIDIPILKNALKQQKKKINKFGSSGIFKTD